MNLLNTNIEYIFSEPEVSTNEAIIFVPGMSGGALSNKYAKLEKLALKENIALLRIQNWRNQKELNGKSLSLIQEELRAAVNFLKGEGYSKISAIGKSFGGMLLLYSQIEELGSLVLWAPVVNISERSSIQSLFNTPFSKIPRLSDITVDENFIAKINSRVLVLWGTNDKIISVDNLMMLKDKLSAATLSKIQGMAHSPNTEEEAECLFRESIDFIKEKSAT